MNLDKLKFYMPTSRSWNEYRGAFAKAHDCLNYIDKYGREHDTLEMSIEFLTFDQLDNILEGEDSQAVWDEAKTLISIEATPLTNCVVEYQGANLIRKV